MSQTTIVLEHTEPILGVTAGVRKTGVRNLINHLEAVHAGIKRASNIDIFPNGAVGAAASGTLTLVTCLAGTEVEVNGVKFRAIAVANGEFVISGDDTADAVSLVAAINGSTDARIYNLLTASSALGVVTVTANEKGALGNGVTIKTNGVVASGTVTCVFALTDIDDTVSINGQAITVKQHKATGTLTAVSSVAGDTFVLDGVTFTGAAGAVVLGAKTFSIDTSDTATATSIAAQINGFAAFSGKLTATSAVGVVTIRAVTSGTAGNSITLVGTAIKLAASAATLANGAAVGNNEFDMSPGSTATQMAVDLVRAIGASSTALVSSHVSATNEAGVVTLWANYPGTAGNHITLASSDSDGLAVSGSGRLAGGTELNSGGTQATATITFSNVANADTITIGGVVFTAHTNTEAANQFNIDGTDTADAAVAAKVINASTSALAKDVVATSSGASLILTARRGGISGNSITLATSSGVTLAITGSLSRLATGAVPTTVVPSAARFASGTGGAVTKVSYTP
jgi:flagellin